MNILFFSQAAWDNKNSVGNTFSNWFDGKLWKDDRFFHIYTRKNLPDNHMNITYYNISAVDIIKGIIGNREKGRIFNTALLPRIQAENAQNCVSEQKKIDQIHKRKNDIIYYGYELIWRSKLWNDQSLKQFIHEASPDIFFAFATSSYILWPLIEYLKSSTKCKIVLFIADDVYGSYNNCAFYRRGYLKRKFKKCILAADKIYAVSDEMSALYATRFRVPITTLYKGCDLSKEPKRYLNTPLRLVYAGNLLWGRDNALAQVVDALEKLNEKLQRATLEIYTATTVTPQINTKLNRNGSSQIVGTRSYEEIKRIMQEADIVLHIESFDEKTIPLVRYSFSTKIIDCLQSGTQVLGIGPSDIASIEYLRKVDGAIVIDEQHLIASTINYVVGNFEEILKNAHRTRIFAQKYHEIELVHRRLRTDMEKLLVEE